MITVEKMKAVVVCCHPSEDSFTRIIRDELYKSMCFEEVSEEDGIVSMKMGLNK